ncbi:polyphosphate polymerase domain-containing protein [uncultured Paludibaculum sp.]|uniref:polyphosphate polymerase domain-containing protein n=1 Tax=uncultured Paludibaculum sp. TaxID=1765020 RepID=UPI002AAB588F|nr:polyphosphate polymerase domain-containing protein [uncultured Paludibaculum sp.]
METLQSPSIDPGQFRKFASELKFVIGRSQAEEVRAWARRNLLPDAHGCGADHDAYTITTLYLDTDGFDVLSRTGSFARGKYRIRRYDSGTAVFLERKMKSHGLVCKRRGRIDLAELPELRRPEADPGWAGYWFHRRILARRLRPVCQISYTRTARMGMTAAGPIRLTLDDALRAVPVNGFAFDSWRHYVPLSGDRIVLELKYRGEVPVLFQSLMADCALVPANSSKYRTAGHALGFGPFRPDRNAGAQGISEGGAPCLTF